MNIGIIGVGNIGKTLALQLAKAGHNVVVANSKAPETINADVLATGARAVSAQEAVQDKDVIILSIPLNSILEVAPLFAGVSDETTVIDTSNYYPVRDGNIDSIEAGQVESLWVVQQLGRPIAKAWNAIGSDSLANKVKPAGSPDRIAIPIASDRDSDGTITKKLVDETGFDAFDTGSLADSWRQQPGAPIYCTDLTSQEMQAVVDTADRKRLPARREMALAAVSERMSTLTTDPDVDYIVRLSRVLYI